jgi:hypothetical protein
MTMARPCINVLPVKGQQKDYAETHSIIMKEGKLSGNCSLGWFY